MFLSLFPSLMVALSLAAAVPEPAQATVPPAAESAIVLDVPYLPQTEAMCGGAAAAMVLRYWGDAHAGVQQFDALVDRRAGGMATTALVAAIEQRQWRTLRTAASIDALRDELRARRPVIVLLQDRPHRYHYVVVIGAATDRFVVHDPTWGPSRRLAAAELMRRWQAAQFWSLVIVPAAGEVVPASRPAHAVVPAFRPANDDSCAQRLATAIDEVQRRGVAEADAIFNAVRSQCPDSAGPLRELAGVRFAARQWRESASLAEQALARDPRDEYAWDVLASSRFMQDDVAGALRAWNQIGKPRVDTVHIEGLSRARYALVADALALPPGALLSEETFRRAERRLDELPGYVDTRLAYRPQRDGFAAVNAVVVESPARPRGPVEWAANGARAAIDREVSVVIPGMSGQGEQWQASWRWWTNRPRVALSFATPHRGVLPGIWRVDGSWEEQSYGIGMTSISAAPPLVERRAHGGITVSDWLTAKVRYSLKAGIDSWNGVRRTTSIGGSLERRFASDRVLTAGDAATWIPIGGGPGFRSAGLRTAFRSSTAAIGTVFVAGGGVEAVSAAAPFALWPGAGDGQARTPLLRGHSLLRDGVIDGAVFGERLAYANGEIQRWIHTPQLLPMRIAVASFVDIARASRRLPAASGDPFQIDAGIGVRVKIPGQRGTLRIDAGHGVRDGANALTFGWQPF